MSIARKYVIGGNWKCNGTSQSIRDLVSNVVNKLEFDDSKVDVVVAPVTVHMAAVKALVNPSVKLAAQNLCKTGNGSYTGEVSSEALKDFGVDWVIIGHSERRTLFNETDEVVAAKVA